MANMVIATPVLSDAATLSLTGGSTTTSGFPLTNLQTIQPSDFCEFVDSGANQFLVDLGSAVPWNLVALIGSNANASTEYRIRAASTSGALPGTPAFDSGSRNFWNSESLASYPRTHAMFWTPNVGSATVTLRWLHINVNHSAAGFRLGRLYVAKAFQPTRNFTRGALVGFDDDSLRDRLPGGPTIITPRGLLPVMEFTLPFLTESEAWLSAHEIDLLRGASRDVFVSLNPATTSNTGRHRKMIYGLLEPGARIVQPHVKVFEHSYRVVGLE